MIKRAVLIFFLVLVFTGAMGVYWLQIGFTILPLREGFYLSTSFIAIIGALFALKKFGIGTGRSITLLLLTAGMAYFFIGDSLFDYYQYILHTDPYPSAADIFYILGYVFMFLGLVNEIRITGVQWRHIDKPTVLLFILIACLLTAVVGYFGIYQVYDANASFFTNLVGISYGIGDLLLILASFLVLILVWEFRGGTLARIWLFILLGFVLFLIPDILFALDSERYESWFYKSLLDSFWMASYLLFAYAFFDFGFSIQDAYGKILRQTQNKMLPQQIKEKDHE